MPSVADANFADTVLSMKQLVKSAKRKKEKNDFRFYRIPKKCARVCVCVCVCRYVSEEENKCGGRKRPKTN